MSPWPRRLAFFASCFAARFSSLVRAGFFLSSFFLSIPLLTADPPSPDRRPSPGSTCRRRRQVTRRGASRTTRRLSGNRRRRSASPGYPHAAARDAPARRSSARRPRGRRSRWSRRPFCRISSSTRRPTHSQIASSATTGANRVAAATVADYGFPLNLPAPLHLEGSDVRTPGDQSPAVCRLGPRPLPARTYRDPRATA